MMIGLSGTGAAIPRQNASRTAVPVQQGSGAGEGQSTPRPMCRATGSPSVAAEVAQGEVQPDGCPTRAAVHQ